MEETWRVRWEEMRTKMKDVEEKKEAEERQARKEQLEGAELGRAIGDMGLNKTSENSEQGNEGEKTRESPVDGGRSYVEVLTQERQGKGDDKDEDRCEEGKEDTRVEEGVKQKRVIVVGSSNVTRCVAGVRSRVGGEEKVKVAAYPGKCMSEVMESAKELVWENQGGKTWSSFMQG
ncbi:unnamed protein product [Ixodes hexagonus]